MAKRDSTSQTRGRHSQRTLFILAAFFFAAVVARLFTLQVIRHADYARFAKDNQLQRERIVAPRGYLRDRNGRILVDNVLHFEVVVPWRERADVENAAASLAEYVPIDTAKVLSNFEAWRDRNGRLPFPVVPDADKFIISLVRENGDVFPKLRVNSRARRRYREGALAAHVLGYVGEASDDDVKKSRGIKYFPGDMIGKTALERRYERELRGGDGQRVLEVNAAGVILGEVTDLSTPPIAGRDIYLTIDADMQAYAEQLLGQTKKPAAAIVMSVADGALLVAASGPSYDPNDFATGISAAKLRALFEAQTKPMFNRMSQARYPPGSTFKIVSSHAVLHHKIVPPGQVLAYCTGAYKFGNRIFRCWLPGGHGWMNLRSAIEQSCDVYFYKIGEIMDVDILAQSARAFGFGARTGIDLAGEVKGLIPDRAYYDGRFGRGRWTQGYILNAIIGQGEYLATVLQVTRMCAAVANGGYLVQPHLIDHVADEPRVAYPRKRVPGLDGSTLKLLQQAMRGVVANPDGTAHWTRLNWLPMAGKTGTSQNPHGDDHAWYTVYAPADNPEVVVTVLVENAGHGGEISAPIARDLLIHYFRPEPEQVTAKPADPVAKSTVPDMEGDGAQ